MREHTWGKESSAFLCAPLPPLCLVRGHMPHAAVPSTSVGPDCCKCTPSKSSNEVCKRTWLNLELWGLGQTPLRWGFPLGRSSAVSGQYSVWDGTGDAA